MQIKNPKQHKQVTQMMIIYGILYGIFAQRYKILAVIGVLVVIASIIYVLTIQQLFTGLMGASVGIVTIIIAVDEEKNNKKHKRNRNRHS